MTPDEERFDSKVKVLKEQVEHHVDEEEGEMFPRARPALDASTLMERVRQSREPMVACPRSSLLRSRANLGS
ncbi:MAG: hypothetical protein ACREEC_08025 [Thermoplasmata archaeon]